MAEQADARDSKSRDSDIISVRFRSSAPKFLSVSRILSSLFVGCRMTYKIFSTYSKYLFLSVIMLTGLLSACRDKDGAQVGDCDCGNLSEKVLAVSHSLEDRPGSHFPPEFYYGFERSRSADFFGVGEPVHHGCSVVRSGALRHPTAIRHMREVPWGSYVGGPVDMSSVPQELLEGELKRRRGSEATADSATAGFLTPAGRSLAEHSAASSGKSLHGAGSRSVDSDGEAGGGDSRDSSEGEGGRVFFGSLRLSSAAMQVACAAVVSSLETLAVVSGASDEGGVISCDGGAAGSPRRPISAPSPSRITAERSVSGSQVKPSDLFKNIKREFKQLVPLSKFPPCVPFDTSSLFFFVGRLSGTVRETRDASDVLISRVNVALQLLCCFDPDVNNTQTDWPSGSRIDSLAQGIFKIFDFLAFKIRIFPAEVGFSLCKNANAPYQTVNRAHCYVTWDRFAEGVDLDKCKRVIGSREFRYLMQSFYMYLNSNLLVGESLADVVGSQIELEDYWASFKEENGLVVRALYRLLVAEGLRR